MSDESTPTIEELQKQILEMKEAREADMAKLTALEEQAKTTEADLKAARELNAKLMNGTVPGVQSDSDKAEDPYADMSDEEFLADACARIVDEKAAEMLEKKKKVTS